MATKVLKIKTLKEVVLEDVARLPPWQRFFAGILLTR